MNRISSYAKSREPTQKKNSKHGIITEENVSAAHCSLHSIIARTGNSCVNAIRVGVTRIATALRNVCLCLENIDKSMSEYTMLGAHVHFLR